MKRAEKLFVALHTQQEPLREKVINISIWLSESGFIVGGDHAVIKRAHSALAPLDIRIVVMSLDLNL